MFSDHGAMSWGDPYRTVPECARVLRPNGRLVFCGTSPMLRVCYDEKRDVIGPALQRPYFDLYRQDEGEGASTYMLPYGDWIRLFRRNGFEVEDLIELRPSPEAETTYYTTEPRDWARLWPAESLWVARRR